MIAMMVSRATDDQSSSWVISEKTDQGVWTHKDAVTSLEYAIAKGATLASDLPFTFTTRGCDDALAAYAETFEQLEGLGANTHAVILCPEGAPVVNRWTHLHFVPVTGAVIGTGVDGRFRPQCLRDQVLAYFMRHQWRSFIAPKVQELHEPVSQQAHRPPHHRELLIRPTWAAREIAPDAFLPLHMGPVVTAEMAARQLAKLPQNKAAARRAQHQANAERFRAEAAERARLRGEVAAQ